MNQLCGCGCGSRVRLPEHTFLYQHHTRGENSPSWNGGKTTDRFGRLRVKARGHHRADSNGYVFAHVLIVEAALGKPVPSRHPTHHADSDPTNNANDNLVLCEDNAYHMLIELRTRAYRACGHASWRKCQHCGVWEPPDKIYISPSGLKVYHRGCANTYHRQWYANKGDTQ